MVRGANAVEDGVASGVRVFVEGIEVFAEGAGEKDGVLCEEGLQRVGD